MAFSLGVRRRRVRAMRSGRQREHCDERAKTSRNDGDLFLMLSRLAFLGSLSLSRLQRADAVIE
jgi:hypothetical protein